MVMAACNYAAPKQVIVNVLTCKYKDKMHTYNDFVISDQQTIPTSFQYHLFQIDTACCNILRLLPEETTVTRLK